MIESAVEPQWDPLALTARELGEHHRIGAGAPRPVPAWAECKTGLDWLDRASLRCARPEPEITKAAEWLLDNEYRIRRAIRQISEDLPSQYYRRLPRLTNTEDEGWPRVYALAHGLFGATRFQLSLAVAVRFVCAYQEKEALSIAELWAFPTMLRLACLEVLVEAFECLCEGLTCPFKIVGRSDSLGAFDDTERVARAIANLAVIESIPWKEFFERVSRVEAILRNDPSGDYANMEFTTRDRYRKIVENLARGAGRSELDVANCVLVQARAADSSGRPRRHVGYWLIGEGRKFTEAALGFRRPALMAGAHWLLEHAGSSYAAALVLTGIAALAVPAFYLAQVGASFPAWIAGMALALLPASILGVTVVHWAITQIVPPRILPKLDFQKGIPPNCATAVVVPVILGNAAEVPALLERLEMHRVTNPDPSLHFVLLSDHADANAERMPQDVETEHALVTGIQSLNTRYGTNNSEPFLLLHRHRRYNPAEGCWMGWERKRGKLEQFNRLVIENAVSAFPVREGNLGDLRNIRFVVTVDADTVLLPGSVNRLVGTLSHPLNSAEFDPASGRVRSGYTVVQPRVEISPESGNRSLFARCYTGDTSIDIYTHAVSDVYQDLFGSGIFIGKGIYEVAPFQRSLESRVPENALLSHDLFEGSHGRAALASDIVLYEGFPSTYGEFIQRWHRWIRGDWQLLPWLFGHASGRAGQHLAARLSLLDRWKIFDNLRRSLIPAALVMLAAAGWLALPGSPWVWTLLTVAAPGAYLFTDLVGGLARGRRRGTVRGALRRFTDHAGRWILAIVFMLHEAAIAVDAVFRTLWRLFVSRRNLLEWRTAAQVADQLANRSGRAKIGSKFWIAPSLSLGLAGAIALIHPQALLPAAPLLLLWFASPGIASWISQPRVPRAERLERKDRTFLRQMARRTWRYFEAFVGPNDNWLPPDNYQEDPRAEIAHRTSPTNIGMLFLSTLTAWDFGYVGSSDFATRIRYGLDALDRLERYRGHFLNWYDTRQLRPLEPRYVSTVDSGNLAVSLLALAEGCREAADAPALRRNLWDGLADTLALLTEAVRVLPSAKATDAMSRITAIAERASSVRDDPQSWHAAITGLGAKELRNLVDAVGKAVGDWEKATSEALHEIQFSLGRVTHHVDEMQREFASLFPWLHLVHESPPGYEALSRRIGDLLTPALSLNEMASACTKARDILAAAETAADEDETAQRWHSDLDDAIRRGAQAQHELRQSLRELAPRAENFATEMDFRLLYDSESRLFHIGFNLSSDRIDPHHYDLLATEARLASYFAIAKHDVPTEHWFFLGRPIAQSGAGLTLLSWNGSMFEYLMPSLLLRSGPLTLLGQSERAAVDAQRRHGDKFGVPWGISESAFASRDADGRYQYQAFGVSELGLHRGLSRDVVVAPYATALALYVRPRAAVQNLRSLRKLGVLGSYGLYEAADYTFERTSERSSFTPVRAYMAHHQGMILAAIGNAIHGDVLVRRFRADPRIRGIELLLQERVPWEVPPERTQAERQEPVARPRSVRLPYPWVPLSAPPFPQLQLLGNGRLTAWISESGASSLAWHRQALTRWLPDSTRDNDGLWIYIRDEDSGALWSAARQPTGTGSEAARVVFHPHMVEFHRRDRDIVVRMEVGIAPGDDIEIRRLTVINESDVRRTLRVTSYAEIVLAPSLDDERHPAFSKLFVGATHLPALNGLIFERRARDPHEKPPVLLHRIVSDELGFQRVGFDTGRLSFLGRGGDPRRPRGAVEDLAGTSGWTLDPIMALQLRLELKPRQKRQFAFETLASGSRESVLELAERYTTLSSLDWAFADAASEAAKEAQQLALEPEWLPALQRLASALICPRPAFRGAPSTIRRNRLGQPRLWGLGISGDLPILLLRTGDPKEMGLLRVLIRAHEIWRRRGLSIDLVVLRTGISGYDEPVRDRVISLLREFDAQELLGRNGGIHLIFADHIGNAERDLLEAVARVVLDESQGTLEQQLPASEDPRPQPPRFQPDGAPSREAAAPVPARPEELVFENGFGGFTRDGSEYVIALEPGMRTPAPWCNILANSEFGSLVSEAGGGFTWALNSGDNRLTAWTNDPVADPPSEALYLRDEETAELWSPTPKPAGAGVACEIRYGAGYAKWRTQSHGLEQELLMFVPPDAPVKVARLRIRNLRSRACRVTATYYAEWLLGALRSVARPHVVCEYDPDCHALLARNPWNPDFADRVAFLTSNLPPHSLTADRRDFLGREGDPARPAGLANWDLGGHVEPGTDPCAAFQVHLSIAAGETAEAVFVLGQGRDHAETARLARAWQDPGRVDRALADLERYWEQQLGAVRVHTPDPAFDLMINRWLLYQTLSSRVLARAGFYQAGGAFGFRDQLQDVLALLFTAPKHARAHILASAAQQFEQGDVLHWWSPPTGRGVRTRCSDDFLWLPYAVNRYVEATGDMSILDEQIAYLHAPPLVDEEHDRFARFEISAARDSLFAHCERALEYGLARGSHGLPLIGSGDWNDGLSRVGLRGRGESVWLAWFAIAAMKGFADLSERMERRDLNETWTRRAAELGKAVENGAWDGNWYLRAFDDEGRPWGASENAECRIDSISQSWAVLTGAGDPGRARTALESAWKDLADPDRNLLRLLWPPFDAGVRDPGYIKAYPPGIRENGGQYAHAAAWVGFAFAALGDGDRALGAFEFANPVLRTSSRKTAEHYRVEPYVVAADIASVEPHAGRGGWTWYTGAAAWSWRLGVEAILGLRLENGRVRIDPCLPKGWDGYEAEIRGPAGTLAIRVADPGHIGKGAVQMTIDGQPSEESAIAFPDDGSLRRVDVTLVSSARNERAESNTRARSQA